MVLESEDYGVTEERFLVVLYCAHLKPTSIMYILPKSSVQPKNKIKLK
jgi:hypothetical protein